MVGEEAADERPDDGRQAEQRTDRAHVLGPLPGRHDVGDDRLRQDHQPAAAEPLHAPPDDEPREVRRQRGTDARHGEQADRDEEEVAAAPQVAELAVDRHDQGGGQQVGGGHPRHVRDAAEVAHDRRHRRRDDRLVQGRHEHAGEQCGEDEVDPAPGEDDRRRGAVGGRGVHGYLLGSYVGAAGARHRRDPVLLTPRTSGEPLDGAGSALGAGRPAASTVHASSRRAGREAVKPPACQRCSAVRIATPATPASKVG